MTPQQANELLQCLHCDVQKLQESSFGDHYKFIECLNCGATGPTGESLAEIIAAWNRRAPAPTSEQDAAELAEWRRLKDPAVLHASLLRGQPARLPDYVFQHIAGVAPTSEPGARDLIAGGALRQYRHNDGSEGFVFGYDKEITDRLLATPASPADEPQV